MTCFIDLTEVRDGLRPYNPLLCEEATRLGIEVVYCPMPLPDYSVPEHPEQMIRILNRIDGAIKDGGGVYVHCWGGIGRTGTVVGCYLVRHGRSGAEALQELATRWRTVAKRVYHPETPQTPEQRRWVLHWREHPVNPSDEPNG